MRGRRGHREAPRTAAAALACACACLQLLVLAHGTAAQDGVNNDGADAASSDGESTTPGGAVMAPEGVQGVSTDDNPDTVSLTSCDDAGWAIKDGLAVPVRWHHTPYMHAARGVHVVRAWPLPLVMGARSQASQGHAQPRAHVHGAPTQAGAC